MNDLDLKCKCGALLWFESEKKEGECYRCKQTAILMNDKSLRGRFKLWWYRVQGLRN